MLRRVREQVCRVLGEGPARMEWFDMVEWFGRP
jgi:hypothetical protein